jgi:predicted DNA-binding transcriptional regulator
MNLSEFIHEDWFKILTIIGSLLVALVYFHVDNNKHISKSEHFINKQIEKIEEFTNKQIEKIEESTTRQIDRLDASIKEQSAKLDASIQKQAERSDRLYEMFVDLLKEQKK